MTACPTGEQLRAFLSDEPVADTKDVEAHIERCRVCQAELDRLTGPTADQTRDGPSDARPPADITRTSDRAIDPDGTRDGPVGPHTVVLPQVLGYDIEGEVGRGGMGVVYKARQLALNRPVALKVVSAGASPDRLVRFRQEAEAVARLQHPNITQIFEVGDGPGLLYLALEYVDGGTLKGQTAGVPQPPREAARLVETLARAVHHAHERRIVHRDLKPANVLLTRDGVPKIADFGLARFLDAGDGMTRTTDYVGTPAYSAPEQVRNQADQIGPATDTYALGVILYELLTGRLPFDAGSVVEVLRAVTDTEPVPPRRLRRSCPRDLETICLKCLRKEPDRRYSTAAALADDLRRYAAGEPIAARPVGAGERLWRWAKRNPSVAGLVTAVGLLLAVVAIGGAVQNYRLEAALDQAKRDRGQAEGDRTAAELDRDAARVAQQETRRQVWKAQLSEAAANTRSGLPGQRFASLTLLLKALTTAREMGLSEDDRGAFRDVAVAALAMPDLEVVKEWTGLPPGSHAVAIDARFERYARSNLNGDVSVHRVADDQVLYRVPGAGHSALVRLCDDGHLLLACEDRGAAVARRGRVWQLDGPEPIRLLEAVMDHDHNLYPCFTPDGGRLVYTAACALHSWDRTTGQIRSWPLPGEASSSLAIAPDGHTLAVPCVKDGRGLLRVVDLITGTTTADLPMPGTIDNGCAWHAGGRVVAVSCRGQVRLWDVPGRKEIGVLAGNRNGGVRVIFEPTGDRLLSNDWSGVVRVWDWRAGRQVMTMPAAWGAIPRVFADDGRHVFTHSPAASDGKLWVSRFVPGRELRTLVRAHPAGWRAVADPGGWHLILRDGHAANGLAVIDRRTGEEVGRVAIAGLAPFHVETSGALLTHNAGGLLRWPRAAGPTPGATRYGPPELVWAVATADGHAASADGGVIAVPAYSAGAIIHHRDLVGIPVRTGTQDDVRDCSVSPDGRWVATGSHGRLSGVGAKVWNARTGVQEAELPVVGFCGVGFSPDGQWLVTSGGGNRLWRVGTWDEGPKIPAGDGLSRWAWSRDGLTLAVGDHGVVWLVRADDGRVLARLPFREQTKFAPLCFSPDGGELYVANTDTGDLLVWDLRLVRQGLAELDLDWDAPPFPAAEPGPSGPVEFVGMNLLTDRQKLAQHTWDAAVKACWAKPFDPSPRIRVGTMAADPKDALLHLNIALTLKADRLDAHYHRAITYIRLRRWADAAADADVVLAQLPRDANTRFVRADALVHLNRPVDALPDLDLVVESSRWGWEALELRAVCYQALGRTTEAAADRAAATATLNLATPAALNKRAWLLVTGPLEMRNPARALDLIRRAATDPSNPNVLNTLGVVLYRNGQYAEADRTLEKSLATAKGAHAGFELFFLTMCRHRLGDPVGAKDAFDRAARWLDAAVGLPPDQADELRQFRAEADALLRTAPGPALAPPPRAVPAGGQIRAER
ncbi:MAG: hypothetical protein JWO38_3269 [Gemmataceae bacterium]|nr:hypothetical protein [Gemmataceae bacterium]